eukprot:NODE_728_length_4760_cov_0.305299.p2 type:complete len:318 gc:universal NODE_728_length_4760_cov_0.305299:693-1646(+)
MLISSVFGLQSIFNHPGQNGMEAAIDEAPSSECAAAEKEFYGCYSPKLQTGNSYGESVGSGCDGCATEYSNMMSKCDYLGNYNYYQSSYTLMCHKEGTTYCMPEIFYNSTTRTIKKFDCTNSCHKYYANLLLSGPFFQYSDSISHESQWSSTDIISCVGTDCDRALQSMEPILKKYAGTPTTSIATYLDGFCSENSASISDISCKCDSSRLTGFVYSFQCAKINDKYCVEQISTKLSNGTSVLNQFDCNNICHRTYKDLYLTPGSKYLNFPQEYADKGWKVDGSGSCASKDDIKFCTSDSSILSWSLFLVLALALSQ